MQRRETRYGNGEVIINWTAPANKGKCEVLNTETASDFGCNKYADGGPFVMVNTKEGAPWHHWVFGPCPTCQGLGVAGTGGAIDGQCCGTGRVRHYDDGYVGENKTCMHPKEKAFGKRDTVTPTCFNCHEDVDPKWVVCPYCTTRLKETAKSEADAVLSPV